MPDWPHQMRARRAAEFCDMPLATFHIWTTEARVPTAALYGETYWRRTDLENALDRVHARQPVQSVRDRGRDIAARKTKERQQRAPAR